MEIDTIAFHVEIDDDLLEALSILSVAYPALSFNQLARESLISIAEAAGRASTEHV